MQNVVSMLSAQTLGVQIHPSCYGGIFTDPSTFRVGLLGWSEKFVLWELARFILGKEATNAWKLTSKSKELTFRNTYFLSWSIWVGGIMKIYFWTSYKVSRYYYIIADPTDRLWIYSNSKWYKYI